MVLRPLDSADHAATMSGVSKLPPAWAVVAERQKQPARSWWLISQPDHANLSGELAANFVSPEFARMEPGIARAIAVHDSGWSMFGAEADPAEPPMLGPDGKPLAFIEFNPQEFLRAWTGSIEQAAGICAAGGIIVSRHFCELGKFRLKAGGLCDHDVALIESFVKREQQRQQGLRPSCEYSDEQLAAYLEVLQFCDLCSLYLCSGAQHDAEFSQKLTGRPVRVSRGVGENEYRFDPSPFQGGSSERVVRLAVAARYFAANGSGNGEPRTTTLRFALT